MLSWQVGRVKITRIVEMDLPVPAQMFLSQSTPEALRKSPWLYPHFVSDDENNQQTGEEVLLSVLDGLEDDKLSSFALRLALTGHADIPGENGIDHLAEAEAVFAPPQPKKAKAKKATPKKAAKNPTPIKTKTAKKKTTKKLAA